jgi:CheY-like chemotaxis protein
MKILVIDDTQRHLAAAQQTLAGHYLTVCNTHDEAIEMLQQAYDETKRQSLLENYKAAGMDHSKAWDRAREESRLPYWDAVLCDLLMPAGRAAQGGEGLKFVGQEMPVGWSLALTAARKGARFVAVVTDMNHHHHPASAMLDYLNGHLFTVDNARMLLTNHVNLVGLISTDTGACSKCQGTGHLDNVMSKNHNNCYYCDGTGRECTEKGKDWGKILDQLLETKKEE